MTEKEIRKIIQKEISDKMLELKNIHESKNTFQKVEKMLWYYNSFKRRIVKLQEGLDEVILKKCSGIAGGFGNTKYEYKSELEKIEDIQERDKIMISKMQTVIDLVEFGLNEVKTDKHYSILTLRYFERLSLEDIAERLDISVITVKRNKSRLINELSLIIFPEEIMENF
ncbi:RNA polymerase sigma factor [Fusobacterium necrophorum]|uniref:RNA polymerase sigma-70 region 4 domain-containing protein n=1 Tax=Fusobacterium necrophorum BL TaxID=1441732 RepID=A0AB73BX26_9FUSO|nr:sigma factor-like helix-turn-helix DNA-binding protein [Fusobacterium necrophorum]AYZ73425.1 hypothetical protein EGX98_04855 [Fusobacterium necrophorum]AZW08578.1 hypothetical protein EO219_02570 [Fusobacterium necrophorum subsp. necrophorum]KDE63811.1 hypothetical protein FUSO3_04440 [Fusobacterium necrophorum BL]MCF0162122.1 hypothetical protein [Fusobacterium necrophorum]MDY2573315.1 sigma factor-like helix-turn-helix DNA-binding protein [Fusobacterium necrophorum]